MKKILFVLMLFSSTQIFAASFSLSGKVVAVMASESNGVHYFGIEVVGLPASTCIQGGKPRIAVATDHPLYATVVSLATAAVVSGHDVSINYSDTCTAIPFAWDFNYIRLLD